MLEQVSIGPTYRRHLVLLGVIFIVAGVVAGSDALHGKSEELIALCEAVVSRSPILGMLLFVFLAMTSAMFFFFSSAILVPIGVYAWGAAVCVVLLWLGWLLGGMTAFAIGRYLGRSVAATLIGEARISSFEAQLRGRMSFVHIVIFQAALPSEIPGYVLGVLRYRFPRYLAALAIVELPYAVATVYLGASFLQRQSILLITAGAGVVLVSVFAYRAVFPNPQC
jgi:uncharacterized membrane protein YdjX (TVP38/TMEM64 family)